MQLIALSASANKLSKLKEQAEEYAALIMEELDPENLGYIEVIYTITPTRHVAQAFRNFVYILGHIKLSIAEVLIICSYIVRSLNSTK